MTELTYDVKVRGMHVEVRCRNRQLYPKAPPGKGDSEYLDIALEAIKADGRDIVQVIPIHQPGLALKTYQVRTKPAAVVVPPAVPDPQP